MKSRLVRFVSAAALLAMTAAHAQSPAVGTGGDGRSNGQPADDAPSPPEDASLDQLKAWKTQHIRAGNYVEALFDADSDEAAPRFRDDCAP